MTTLYPHQQEAAAWLAPKEFGLLADSMGVGKTRSAIHAVLRTDAHCILVVAPNAIVARKWEQEIREDDPSQFVVLMESKKPVVKDAMQHARRRWYITNYSALQSGYRKDLINNRSFDIVIFDESHYLKNRNTKRWKNWHALALRCKQRWLLSATPLVHSSMDVVNQVKLCGQTYLGNALYKQVYWESNQWGMKPAGWTNHEEARRLMEPYLLRRLKKDVLKDLPQMHRQSFCVHLDQNKLMAEIAQNLHESNTKNPKHLINYIGSAHSDHGLTDKEFYTLLGATLRATGRLKAMQLKEWLADLVLAKDERVVVFAEHKNVLNILADDIDASETPYGIITGDQLVRERNEYCAKLNAGEINLVFATYGAAGVGIDLVGASTCVLAELSWSLEKMIQAEARLHRIGQTSDVIVHIPYAVSNFDFEVERSVVKSLNKKAFQADAIYDHEQDQFAYQSQNVVHEKAVA